MSLGAHRRQGWTPLDPALPTPRPPRPTPVGQLIEAFHPTPSTYRGLRSAARQTHLCVPARLGTGHPTPVGPLKREVSPRPEELPLKTRINIDQRVRDPPLRPPFPNRVQRNRVGFDSLDFFGWFGSASVEASRTRCPPQLVPSTGGGGFTVPPHLGRPATWCQCPRARGHHTCNFHAERNPLRLAPKARPVPLHITPCTPWCEPARRKNR